jgi:hypothetical protein
MAGKLASTTGQLVRYDEARRALEAVTTIDEAKDFRDKAEALRAYAAQRGDVEMERWVAEIKLRACIRIGEISSTLEDGRGANQHFPTHGKILKSAALKAAGISVSTAHRCEQLAACRDDLFAYIAQKASKRQPVKYTEALKLVEARRREKHAMSGLYSDQPPCAHPGIHVGDFRYLADKIEDESVELVFTDPPYDADSVHLYADAARIAARILKPGGSFIAYCGQYLLPTILPSCSEHLRYFWTLACLHVGAKRARMNRYGIVVNWKPMVWFVKAKRGDIQTFVDDAISGGREKSHHEWQQAEAEASYYIEKLTSPNGVVVDFFLGGGTTAVAAEALGRRWIGFEIDPVVADRASDRLARVVAA